MKVKNIREIWNKGLIFFKPSSANYWHLVTPCFITQKPEIPGRYYLDFTSKAEYPQNLDSNGIPLFRYFKGNDALYHPIAISQYALGLFDRLHQLKFDSEEIKMKFLRQADWLIENRQEYGKVKCWYFNHQNPRYKVKAPYCSSMAQGEGISVLCRAYILTADEKYLNVAEESLLPFEKSVEDGGVVNKFKNMLLYEECPALKITGILNGYIFSLFGLFDLSLIRANSKAKNLFDIGIENISMLLKWYDLGYWSRYDLYEFPLINPASFTYHNIHIEQLKALFIITGKDIFREYSIKWSEQNLRFKNRVLALTKKMIYLRKIKSV